MTLKGFFFHGHILCNKLCRLCKKMESSLAEECYTRTVNREKYIRTHCRLVTIWECSYYNLLRRDKNLQSIVNESRPDFYRTHKGGVTSDQILRSVKSRLFMDL